MSTPQIILVACIALFCVSCFFQSEVSSDNYSPLKTFLRWLAIYIVCMIMWFYWNTIDHTFDNVLKALPTRPK